MTLGLNGNDSVAQNLPAPAELTPPEGHEQQVDSQQQIQDIQQPAEHEKDFLDSVIENDPSIAQFAANPTIYAPQYLQPQQPQQNHQQPIQQPNYQQLQPQQSAQQQSADIDFNSDELQEFIDNDDWAGFAKAIAQKAHQGALSQQLTPEKIIEIADQRARQLYEQQQAVTIVSNIRAGVLNSLSKSGVSITPEQQLMIENHAKSPAYINGTPIIDQNTRQPMSKLDAEYSNYRYKAQAEGKPVENFTNFSIRYLANTASKAFGKQSKAPNTQIRQTMNEIHSHSQPVIAQQEGEDATKTKIMNMTDEEFQAHLNSRKRQN